jgi:hypothetical protein
MEGLCHLNRISFLPKKHQIFRRISVFDVVVMSTKIVISGKEKKTRGNQSMSSSSLFFLPSSQTLSFVEALN